MLICVLAMFTSCKNVCLAVKNFYLWISKKRGLVRWIFCTPEIVSLYVYFSLGEFFAVFPLSESQNVNLVHLYEFKLYRNWHESKHKQTGNTKLRNWENENRYKFKRRLIEDFGKFSRPLLYSCPIFACWFMFFSKHLFGTVLF